MLQLFKIYACISLFFSCTVMMESTVDGTVEFFGVEGGYFDGLMSRKGYESGLLLSDEAAFFYQDYGYEWSIKKEGNVEELSSIDYQNARIQLISFEILPLSRKLIVGEKIESGTYDVVLSIYTQGKVNNEGFLIRKFEKKIFIQN